MELREALIEAGWFTEPGAYILVDGQFGSTGKGLVASAFAEAAGDRIDWVTTNAGPNSGHTGYIDQSRISHLEGGYKTAQVHEYKIVTHQLPVAWCAGQLMGGIHSRAKCYLNAGAVIDLSILRDEVAAYRRGPFPVHVHPHAAIIDDALTPSATTEAVASTGRCVGEAISRKILRDPAGVFGHHGESGPDWTLNYPDLAELRRARIFIETAQGFSLGINSGFYPYTTSRECTVAQAMADARLHPTTHRKTIMVCRTFPIRVGNTDKGTSGPGYPDQIELDWDDLGVDPEFTTTTKRQRRIFSWSWRQFGDALRVNRPDALVINFCQYVNAETIDKFLTQVHRHYLVEMCKPLDLLLTGWGPKNSDLRVDERSGICQ